MDLKLIQNISKKEASINLLSDIGGDGGIQGQTFADEMTFLNDTVGVDVINIHLASDGGSVSEGLIIYHAILNSKAFVNIFIEGIAASMGGVIAMAGDRIHMTDASQLMIHLPHGGDGSENALKAISAATESLLVAVNNRATVAESTIARLMKDETWINAVDALNKFGLIDEIVPTKKKKTQSKEAKAAMAEILNLYNINNNTNKNDMKDIAKHFGLSADASEAAILKAAEKVSTNLETRTEELKTANETIEANATVIEDLNAKIEGFEAKAVEVEDALVEETIDKGIEDGKFDKDAKEDLVAKFKGNSSALKLIVGKISTKAPSISDKLNGKPSGSESKLSKENQEMSWRDMDKSGKSDLIKNVSESEWNAKYVEVYGKNHPDFVEEV